MITDAAGTRRRVYGMYGAVSFDEGTTWPYKRLISDDGPGKTVECTGGGLFTMSGRHAEYRGYMAVCQSADNLIHLISSREHYAFNLKWLMTPPPPLRYPPVPVQPVVETFSGPDRFDVDGWVDYHSYRGKFTGDGRFRLVSLTHHNGINWLVGRGSWEAKVAMDNIQYYPRGERISEGMAIWIKDGRPRSLGLYIKEDGISVNLKDLEPKAPPQGESEKSRRGSGIQNPQVAYPTPPKSAKLRFLWNETDRRMRIFCGLNGEEATTELPASQKGMFLGQPLSESTAFYLLMTNGSIDLDHFELRSVGN
jgi:hypothetical protein